MNTVPPNKFDNLKNPTESCNEPLSDEVGVHAISKMIAKKTKFRVADVEEVMREVGPVIFAILLARKTVDLDGVYLRNRWVPNDIPRYIRNGDGFWTFGYFNPKLELDRQKRSMYIGKDIVYRDNIVEDTAPYLSDEIKTADDMRALSIAYMKETGALGKELLVDEEGYYFTNKKKGRKRFFDKDFHPTWGELMSYYANRHRAIQKYQKLKSEGKDVEFGPFVTAELESAGFKIGRGEKKPVE